MSQRRIRPARADEGAALGELAVRAKSHWGYDTAFLEGARSALTIDADTIAASRIYVVEDDGAVVGFYGLVGEPPEGRLEWMFLEPGSIGHGLGRLLWDDAMRVAGEGGFTTLLIESDRYAEPFYLAMGADRIGSTVSPVDGAALPLLRVRVG